MGATLSILDQYKRAKKICPHSHACRFAWSPTIIVPRAVQVSATVQQVKLITAPSHSPEATADSLSSDVCCSVGHACPVLARGRRRPKLIPVHGGRRLKAGRLTHLRRQCRPAGERTRSSRPLAGLNDRDSRLHANAPHTRINQVSIECCFFTVIATSPVVTHLEVQELEMRQ